MTGLVEYGRLPLVPAKTLRKHHAYEATDSRFRSAARLRQALFREQQGWPIGDYLTTKGSRRKLGSYVSVKAAARSVNFITPAIARLAAREIAYREDGALFDEDRIARNMLSSAPLTFNALGPLKLDLKLATRVMTRIAPGFVKRVSGVLFEHSPGRSNPTFTADRTAFDVCVRCRAIDSRRGFIAAEVKYTETMLERPARSRPRYDELSRSSGLYRDPDHESLRQPPLQQLWRQHMLAAAMVQNGLYDAGRFVLIAPGFNTQVVTAARRYEQHLLTEPSVPFRLVLLEELISAISWAGASNVGALLYDRFLNFDPVDSLI